MFRLTIHLLLIVLILMGMSACSLSPQELKVADAIMETAPDSALHILQKVQVNSFYTNKNKAWYGLLLMRALDKNLLPLKPDSLLDLSINYYENHSEKKLLATAYYLKGRGFIKRLQYEQATAYFLKALDVLEGSEDYLLSAKIYNMLGEIYIVQRDYVTSREKYSKAYESFIKAGNTNLAFYALLDIGRTYSQSKQIKQAQQCFVKAYQFSNDSLSKGAAIQEMATNYISIKQYDSALLYFNQTLHYPTIGYNRAIQYYNLADLYFEMKQIDSSFNYALKALKSQPDIRIKKECYRILVNVSGEFSDMTSLKKYMICYQECSDSIRKIDTQTRGSVLETIHESKKEVSKSHRWIGTLILTLLLLAGGSGWWVFRVRRGKDRTLAKTKEQYQTEKGNLHLDVLRKHSDTLLKKIEDKKSAMANKRKNLIPDAKNELDRKIYNDILHYDDNAYFHKQMDAVSNNLISKLRSRYPSLTNRELCWVCLYLLRIPQSDILLLLDYKQEAFKKMKVRLIKKLNLQYVSMIPDFLQKMLLEEDDSTQPQAPTPPPTPKGEV